MSIHKKLTFDLIKFQSPRVSVGVPVIKSVGTHANIRRKIRGVKQFVVTRLKRPICYVATYLSLRAVDSNPQFSVPETKIIDEDVLRLKVVRSSINSDSLSKTLAQH